MRILITGGAGFIGTNIATLARKQNHHVMILDSFVRPGVEENAAHLSSIKCDVIRGDVRNAEDLGRLPKKPDAIIHLAANPGIPWSIAWPLYDFSANALGTLHVLEYARANGKVPVVLASTNKIYSEEINLIATKKEKTRYAWDFASKKNNSLRPAIRDGISARGVNERFPMDSSGAYPHSPYGVSKCAADLYAQEYYHIYGVPTVINRMSCIYGLYQKGVEDQGWMDWFVRAKKYGKPLTIYGDGKQVRDALFGEDLARLYLSEIEHIDTAKGQVFNVGGGMKYTTSLVEVIDYLDTKSGKKLKLSYKDWRPADQRIYISDTSKVKKMLKWEPTTSVRDGLDMIWDAISD